MKKIMISCIAVWSMLFTMNTAHAEMITFASRYFAERSGIRGYLANSGEQGGNKIQVEILIGSTDIHGPMGTFPSSFKFTFTCEDKWDWEKVRKSTNSIANYINKNNDIDLLKMLSESGLSGCKWIQ